MFLQVTNNYSSYKHEKKAEKVPLKQNSTLSLHLLSFMPLLAKTFNN